MKSNTPAFWCPLRDFALAIVCLAATLSLRAADEAKKVLCTTAIDLGTRSVIFQRVEPPKEAVPVAAVQAAAISTRTAAETAALAARARLVERVVLDLSCTVHETGVTELRWWHEGAEFRVLSSVDFLQLRGLGGFEAEGRSYTLFLGIGTAMSAGTKARLTAQGVRLPASVLAPAPVLPADVMQDIARNGGSRYVVISAPEKADAEAYEGIDALHRYFDAHKDEIIAAWNQSEAERAAQEQWLREHPPVPRDTVIQFWPKKGSRYLDAGAGGAATGGATADGKEGK